MTKRNTAHKILSAATGMATAFTLSACGILSGSDGSSGDDNGSSGEGWAESDAAAESGVSPMLFLGDSVAAQQALPVGQAMAESGSYFVNGTSTGGGNIVGPNAEASWEDLPERLEEAEGGAVVYQLTSYDWGTPDEQREAYEDLAEATREADADLLLISMPPIEPDEFYEPHMDELASATDVAQNVADENDTVEYLDATAVWGDEYSREHEGEVDRSEDGIHTCPQGAARFTAWLMDQMAELYPEFAPADPEEWANTGWADDEAFFGCE